MSTCTFKNKNSLRKIEAQIAQKLKNNEAQPNFAGSYKKKCVHPVLANSQSILFAAFTLCYWLVIRKMD